MNINALKNATISLELDCNLGMELMTTTDVFILMAGLYGRLPVEGENSPADKYIASLNL